MSTEPTSLRAYFAANAPADPPAWFSPAMDHLQSPPKPEMSQELQAHIKAMSARLCGLTTTDGLPIELTGDTQHPAVEQYKAELEVWGKQVRQAEQARTEHHYFAWRWYYADKMAEHKQATTKPVQIPAMALSPKGL